MARAALRGYGLGFDDRGIGAERREAGGGNEADIAAADHCDAHESVSCCVGRRLVARCRWFWYGVFGRG
jgi:hypothetical protein